MDDLKELIRIITKNKVSKIEIIGQNSSRRSKVQELYHGIASGQFKTDEEAAYFFYGTSSDSQTYKKLKYRLRKRLIDTIFFIDVNQPSFTDAQRAYYSCHKEWAAINLLIRRGGKGKLFTIAEQLLKKAIEFEITEIVVEISRLLRTIYSNVKLNHSKYKEYDALVDIYSDILILELKAEKYNTALTYKIGQSRASRIDLEEEAIRYSNELQDKVLKNNSYRFHIAAFRVLALRYQVVNDYKGLLNVCKKAIHFFEHKEGLSFPNAIFLFQYRLVACLTQLNRFEEGEQEALKCLALPIEGGHNWFAAYYTYLVLLFRSQQYSKALITCMTAMHHSTFKKQTTGTKELFSVLDAYLQYFIAIDVIDKKAIDPHYVYTTFKLNRFLNGLPEFSKDKRGMNIHILIIQVLFLLQQGKHDIVIDRVETLNMYCSRYLKKDDTFRSNCFIKMLLQLPIAGFHRAGVERKAEKFFKKLQSVPIEIAEQSTDVEIVPYERLWQYVLDSLGTKFYFHERYIRK